MGESKSRQDTLSLLLKARDGDQSAFEALLEKYTPLIDASVLSCLEDGLYSLYADDFRQEAAVVFYNSVLTYDIGQNEVEFGLYAKICISNALRSQLRLLKKHTAERLADEADGELFALGADAAEDPSLRVLEREGLRELYSAIKEKLSALEYRVWRLYTSGRTARDIAALIGKDERSVNNAIYRIRKKLREQL